MKNYSIRARLTIFFTATVVIIILLFDLLIFLSFKNNLLNNIESSLLSSCSIITGEIFKQDISGKLIEEDIEYEDEISRIAELFPIETAELIEFMGHIAQLLDVQDPAKPIIIARSHLNENMKIPDNSELVQKIIRSKSSKNEYYFEKSQELMLINLYITDHLGNKFVLQIAETADNFNNDLNRIFTSLLIASPLFVLILSLFGYFLIRTAFKPVTNIVEDVNKITAKDLSLRIKPVSGKDEIGKLINTFNNLIERLERSFNLTKQFSIDVSHELKTPLTVLRGEIEVILRHSRSEEEYVRTLNSLVEEVIKLQEIIDNLLLLANLDASRKLPEFIAVDLNELILETFENLHWLATQKNQNIEIREIPSISIQGDKTLLIRLFSNILENAIKYSPKNGKITIFCNQEKDKIKINVQDSGPGISKEFQDKIFERFFRIDDMYQPIKSKSSGLGLALAKKIAELHNITIKLKNSSPLGCIFTLIAPVKND